MWKENTTLNFHVTEKEENSSLFKPDKDVIGSFEGKWSDTKRFEIIKTKQVKVTTLNDMLDYYVDELKKQNIDIEFGELKLDTQGSEYEIIQGADKYISKFQWVITEAEIEPIYIGQKLFEDVKSLLSNYGFEFVKWNREVQWGRPVFGDALFKFGGNK